MVTTRIGTHKVTMYDSIEELPIMRFHRYQRALLVDAGVGGDIASFDQHTEKMRRYLMTGKADLAAKELENLRQNVFLVQSGITPRHRAFAALVTEIDGKVCDDLTDAGIERVLETLKDALEKDVTGQLASVKKKIDAELSLYFPRLFDDVEIKEYFDLLRRRTLEVLKGIIEGVSDPTATDAAEKLTTALILYSNPKEFTGSEGVEVQFDRQFENLCLVLSEQLNVEPKKYTVLEFYNAFDFVQERARTSQNAQKRGKFAR